MVVTPLMMSGSGIMVNLLWLRVCCPRFSRTYGNMQNPCQKENALFKQKSQGGKTGLKALINACTKMYTEIHFYMPYKTQKAPPQRSPHFSVSQNPFAKERVFEFITRGLDDVPLLQQALDGAEQSARGHRSIGHGVAPIG